MADRGGAKIKDRGEHKTSHAGNPPRVPICRIWQRPIVSSNDAHVAQVTPPNGLSIIHEPYT